MASGSVKSYIDDYWDKITKSSTEDKGTLIGLPNPYIVPNEGLFKEFYYWDTFFILEALAQDSSYSRLALGLVENCIYLFDRFGIVPNANRFYFLSRSQPPFLSSMIGRGYEIAQDILGEEESLKWLSKAYGVVKKEYHTVWLGEAFPHERCVYKGLSRYYDLNIWHCAAEAESGWDMTTRFSDRCLDYVAVDLNSLLYKYEVDLSNFAETLGLGDESVHYQMLSEKRKKTVNTIMWDGERGGYFDYDYVSGKRSGFVSCAGLFPLWAGLADRDQAEKVVNSFLPRLECRWGLSATEELQNGGGGQWNWPNGWAPLVLIAVWGLSKYGYQEIADRIAGKWLNVIERVFDKTGKLYEKYDVVKGDIGKDGRYPTCEGFAWTNASYLILLRDRNTKNT